MGYYHTAQICLNGHVITDSYDQYPEHGKSFCDTCGEKTITQCLHCGSNIHGDYEEVGVCCLGFSTPAPAYCYNCGKPFPWTESNLNSLKELLLLENLTDSETAFINNDISEILVESPKSKLVSAKLKLILDKSSKVILDSVKSIIVDIGSETAKKIILGE